MEQFPGEKILSLSKRREFILHRKCPRDGCWDAFGFVYLFCFLNVKVSGI